MYRVKLELWLGKVGVGFRVPVENCYDLVLEE